MDNVWCKMYVYIYRYVSNVQWVVGTVSRMSQSEGYHMIVWIPMYGGMSTVSALLVCIPGIWYVYAFYSYHEVYSEYNCTGSGRSGKRDIQLSLRQSKTVIYRISQTVIYRMSQTIYDKKKKIMCIRYIPSSEYSYNVPLQIFRPLKRWTSEHGLTFFAVFHYRHLSLNIKQSLFQSV